MVSLQALWYDLTVPNKERYGRKGHAVTVIHKNEDAVFEIELPKPLTKKAKCI